MDAVVDNMAQAMSAALGPTLAVFLLSIIPIAEARLAILQGLKMGLNPGAAFGWAFLGSSLIAPILLLLFMPIINALSKTKLFSKIGLFLYDKFEKKSRALKDESKDESGPDGNGQAKKSSFKADAKKIGGVALFVAVPLPLTGVWTGSAVAAILKIGFAKSLVGVLCGNAVACALITLLGYLLYDYINIITWIFFAVIAAVVLALIIKFILYKPDKSNDPGDGKE